jgi:hypothetical protein
MSTLLVNTLVPVSGDTINVSGSLSIEGEIILGDSPTDSISFDGKVSSSILPSSSNIFNLGASTLKWNNVYATNFIGTSSLASNAVTSSYAITSSHTNTADTVTANSQPNITSLGQLTSLQVGAISATSLSSSGTVIAATFVGDASGLTNVTASTSTITTGVITSSLYISESLRVTHITASGNISASGTVYADSFSSFGNDDLISFQDNINLSGSFTSSGTITASALFSPTIRFPNTYNMASEGQWRINSAAYRAVSSSDFFEAFMHDSGYMTMEFPETFHIGILNNSNNSTAYGSKPYQYSIGEQISSGTFLPGAGDTYFAIDFDGNTITNNITSSGTISASNNIYGNNLYSNNSLYLNNTSSLSISTSSLQIGTHSSITAVEFNNPITSSIVSASGDIKGNSFTLHINSPAGTDSSNFTAHGNKIQMRNQLQSAITNGSNQRFTITNDQVTEESVIYGNFVYKENMGGLSQSIIQCHADSGSFFAMIHNESGTSISNNTSFTASFVVM